MQNKKPVEAPPASPPPVEHDPNAKHINLLVIDSDPKNWYEVFKGVTCKDGSKIKVEKSRWYEINKICKN